MLIQIKMGILHDSAKIIYLSINQGWNFGFMAEATITTKSRFAAIGCKILLWRENLSESHL